MTNIVKTLSSFEPLPGTRTTQSGKAKPKRVLGIDPGLANTGFGIVDYCSGRYRVAAYGVIETRSDSQRSERLLLIYDKLSSVIEEFNPEEAAMETLFFAKNVSSAMSVSESRGVISLCLAQRRVPLNEYAPNQIKQAVTGTAAADKSLVEKYLKLLLGLESEPKPDHAADALACAITHIHNHF